VKTDTICTVTNRKRAKKDEQNSFYIMAHQEGNTYPGINFKRSIKP
jgi:hypothetical protein